MYLNTSELNRDDSTCNTYVILKDYKWFTCPNHLQQASDKSKIATKLDWQTQKQQLHNQNCDKANILYSFVV